MSTGLPWAPFDKLLKHSAVELSGKDISKQLYMKDLFSLKLIF